MNAIYTRQSVDRADSVSIESQIEYCKYEVKKEAFQLYTDKGFSGKNTERPEFQMMINHIKQGIIKKVIVYKLDRISRSILDFSNMMEIFQEYGVEFVSTTEKFDTSTPMGRAMLNICIVFAQLERETIQKRVADAYASRSKMGFYMGGRVPYGFSKIPVIMNGVHTSQYIPIDHEVEHLQIIFERYSKPATTLGEIIKYFRDNNIEKSRGIEWSTPRLSEILRNPIYVKADVDLYNFYASRNAEIINAPDSFIGENGCYLYTKNTKNIIGGKKNMAQYDNMVLVLAPHKGIVDSETWIKCRLKAEQNVQIPNARRGKKTWVSGKLKCGKCGYALKYNKWVGKTVENEYFLCSEVSNNRRCTGFGIVKKDAVEDEILKQIKEKVKQIKIEQNKPDKNQAEINALKSAIANKEREIQEILDKLLDANEAVLKYINTKVEQLDTEIIGLKNELLKYEISKSSKSQLDTDMINEIFKSWKKIDIKEKQAIADVLIKKVLVTDESIEIVWKV